jgi:hypothetical protein
MKKRNVGMKNSQMGLKYRRNTWKREREFAARRSTKESRKEEICKIVALSEPDGRSTSELVKDTGYHRDTIHVLCKELEHSGLVIKKVRKYHLKPKAFEEDAGLNGFLFNTKIRKGFYHLVDTGICAKNIFCDHKLCERALNFDENRSEDLIDKIHFFEFALRLGAITTYQLIQSMRYSQQKQYSRVSNKQPRNIILNNLIRNEQVFKYIENVLKPSSLIHIFRHLYPVRKRLKEEPQDLVKIVTSEEEARKHQQQSKSFPSYLELQDGEFEQLEKMYQETFPELFKELETIRTIEIPKEIDVRKQQIEHAMTTKMLERKDSSKV